MALPIERDELLAAWRALDGQFPAEAWRSISVGVGGPCRLMAGRHFPGNEEALIVALPSDCISQTDQLPQGEGFHISRPLFPERTATESWVALCRHRNGRLDLFATMAVDIIGTLSSLPAGDTRIASTFFGRIKAWQDFMRIAPSGLLSPEAELGLVGELEVMRLLMSIGVPDSIAINAWKGPLDGVHDFAIGCGAIEVKTTLSQIGFPAKINSLEQLDDSIVRPLFLCAVRMELCEKGQSLPMIVSAIRQSLFYDRSVLTQFDGALLHSGYLESLCKNYTRLFRIVDTHVLPISEAFPRITRKSVPTAVRSAYYEIDLDLVMLDDINLIDALRALGV